jgi:Holliday junction resolvasome RuvABC endonuclease subunit
MILGLDISTSITGFTILNDDGTIAEIGSWDTRNKKQYLDWIDKVKKIKYELAILNKKYSVSEVFIEPALNMFMMGKSSAHTISTLIKFNGIVSWLVYEIFEIDPEYIPAVSARKKCGLTVKRGTKAKEQVIKFLLDTEPAFSVEYTKNGNLKPHCYDEADSLIIAKAGYECLKERYESLQTS